MIKNSNKIRIYKLPQEESDPIHCWERCPATSQNSPQTVPSTVLNHSAYHLAKIKNTHILTSCRVSFFLRSAVIKKQPLQGDATIIGCKMEIGIVSSPFFVLLSTVNNIRRISHGGTEPNNDCERDRTKDELVAGQDLQPMPFASVLPLAFLIQKGGRHETSDS